MTNRSLLLIPLLLTVLGGCEKASDDIWLVCTGTEKTSLTAGERKGESESRKVTKSLHFFEDVREIKSEKNLTELNIGEGKAVDTSSVKKKTWVLEVDDHVPYFEENSIKRVINTPHPSNEENNIRVYVDKTTLGLFYLRRYYMGKKKIDKFETVIDTSERINLTVNRITGVYVEQSTASYGDASYVISTEGSCIPGAKKF